MTWEINYIDNTVDLTICGVVFCASVDFFNVERTFVKSTYWNDGLQEVEYTTQVNILETDDITNSEIIECFEKIPHKNLNIITNHE